MAIAEVVVDGAAVVAVPKPNEGADETVLGAVDVVVTPTGGAAFVASIVDVAAPRENPI